MRYLFSILLCSLFIGQLAAQKTQKLSFFEPADTLHSKRFWIASGTGATIYTSASIGLWNAWYKNYEISSFHLFDDRGEWENMDKVGHFWTAYYYSRWLHNGARWTGMEERKGMWTGVVVASLLQGTIEVMDGFSDKWGFSMADIGMNTLGASFYAGQELLWEEQRITIKMSSYRRPYPTDLIYSVDGLHSTTLAARADALYGSSFAEIFLKDYNAQTYWTSVNIHAFLPKEESKFPRWLNIAVGYSGENMYAGFGYDFNGPDGGEFVLDPLEYPRYRQYFLSLDVDLTKIKTKNHALKMLFQVVNFLKVPAPTLEINSLGNVKFHPIYW